MARHLTQATIVALALAVCGPLAQAQENITLTFANGRVTLVAKDAPLNRVLAEWQRLGGTRFVNGERLPGALVTVTLTDMPERQALAVLLRPFSGYMASPRTADAPIASVFGVVLVMPTLARATPAPSPSSPGSFQPPNQPRPMNRGFGRPGIQIGGDPNADQSDPDMNLDPQDMPEAQPPGVGGAPFPGMPTAPPGNPQNDPTSGLPGQTVPPAFPGVPGTVTFPGMVVPTAPAPGSGPPKLPKPPGRTSEPLP